MAKQQASEPLMAVEQAAPAPALGHTLEAMEEARREPHLGRHVLEVGRVHPPFGQSLLAVGERR